MCYKDITDITGIRASTIRKFGNDRSSFSAKGVEISVEQIDHLKLAMEEVLEDALDNYDILEETYIP